MFNNLKTLKLSGASLEFKAATAAGPFFLPKILTAMTHLRELSLPKCGIKGTHLEKLFEFMAQTRTLYCQTLELSLEYPGDSYYQLEEKCLNVLADAGKSLKSLEITRNSK